jgi:hypothetical protein
MTVSVLGDLHRTSVREREGSMLNG